MRTVTVTFSVLDVVGVVVGAELVDDGVVVEVVVVVVEMDDGGLT